MDISKITKEVDWFCIHLTQLGILTKDDCATILQAIEDNPDVIVEAEANGMDLLDVFYQVMADNDLVQGDEAIIERMVVSSREEGRLFGFPSTGIFAAERNQEIAPRIVREKAPKPEIRHDEEPQFSTVEEVYKKVLNNPIEQPPVEEYEPMVEEPIEKTADINFDDWPDLEQLVYADEGEARKIAIDFLRCARRTHCSDVHVSSGSKPFVRRFQVIYILKAQPVISDELARKFNLPLLTEEQKAHFAENQDLDFCYSVNNKERYRGNLMSQRQGMSGAYRIINDKIVPIRELGFINPEVIEKLTTYTQGLILLTGPSGCGKTTTMNSLLNFINQQRYDHIITVEDPIENVIPSIHCNVTQRQLALHTKSYGAALKGALREDPDIIAIGEMRDLETIEMAIRAAETGHLVFGTLHTRSAAATIDRILDAFPPNQQSQIRSMVSESIRGIICQQLFPNKDNNGMVMAAEVMLGTMAVGNLIREGKTYQLNSSIQIGRNIGMCSMEECILELYIRGKRSFEQTKPYITSADLIRRMQAEEAKRLASANPNAAAASKNAKKRKWF